MSPLDFPCKNTPSPQIEGQIAGVTPHLQRLMTAEGPDGPISRQFTPTSEETQAATGDLYDPTGDAAHSPVKGIVHRYSDRVLLTPVMACAAYCRFCFRRERVGQPSLGLAPHDLDRALAYIRARPEIWEVILSGGDPLLLSANKLKSLINALTAIPHVRVIRVHTRLPIADPEKITAEVVSALKAADQAVYVAVHCNHADELCPEALAACARFTEAGISVLGQTVLLKGVNDRAATLCALFRRMVAHRIKPYYLHHCDPAPGNSHFRLSITEGQAIVSQVWEQVSGLCRPHYVLDGPDGRGKASLTPCAISGDEAG